MYKITLTVDGMMCGMCEAHVSDAIREVCDSKARVSASHTEGKVQIIMNGQPDIARIKAAVKETGYRVTGVQCEAV